MILLGNKIVITHKFTVVDNKLAINWDEIIDLDFKLLELM